MDVNELIEKGKKSGLTDRDFEDALDDLDYDIDKMDKVYDALEDGGIPVAGEMSRSKARSKTSASARIWRGSLSRKDSRSMTPFACTSRR